MRFEGLAGEGFKGAGTGSFSCMTLRTLSYGNYGIFLIMGNATLRTLNYGNYGIFLIMGNAGFCPSAVFMLTGWFQGLEMDYPKRKSSFKKHA